MMDTKKDFEENAPIQKRFRRASRCNKRGRQKNDSNTKILGLVNLRRFQGFELATWPHERPEPWFASHRLRLD